MSTYEERLASFTAWPHASPTPHDLARAGFSHMPTKKLPDNVICEECDQGLCDWQPDEDPAITLRILHPSCSRLWNNDIGSPISLEKPLLKDIGFFDPSLEYDFPELCLFQNVYIFCDRIKRCRHMATDILDVLPSCLRGEALTWFDQSDYQDLAVCIQDMRVKFAQAPLEAPQAPPEGPLEAPQAGNILVSDGGWTVKLADFGLATKDYYTNDFGCGSTFYMSPECQETPLRSSYVWSLGIILVNQISLIDTAIILDFILSRIFETDPLRRISIPELRTLIIGCSRFITTSTGTPLPTPPPEQNVCLPSEVQQQYEPYTAVNNTPTLHPRHIRSRNNLPIPLPCRTQDPWIVTREERECILEAEGLE